MRRTAITWLLVLSVAVLAIMFFRVNRTNARYAELLNNYARNSFNTGLARIQSMGNSLQRITSQEMVSAQALDTLRWAPENIPPMLGETTRVTEGMRVRGVSQPRRFYHYLYFELASDIGEITRALPSSTGGWPLTDEARARLAYHNEVFARLIAEIESYQSLEEQAPTPLARFVWSDGWKELLKKINSVPTQINMEKRSAQPEFP